MFQKASRKRRLFRAALIGPSGSGKTLSALKMAKVIVDALAPGKRIRMIDTENHSSELYAGRVDTEVGAIDFDVLPIPSPEHGLHDYHPDNYVKAIKGASSDGQTGVLIIDSASHAWTGAGGVLEQKDKASQTRGVNDFTAWRYASPLHAKFVDAMIFSPFHLIVCMRAKTEYAMQDDPRTGKKQVVKLGMAAEQRQGLEYEFDVVMDMTMEHRAIVSKTRCADLDGRTFDMPGKEPASTVVRWLGEGVEEITPAPAAAVGAKAPGPSVAAGPTIGGEPNPALSTPAPAKDPVVDSLMQRLAVVTTLEQLEAVGKDIAANAARIPPKALAEMREFYNDADAHLRRGGK